MVRGGLFFFLPSFALRQGLRIGSMGCRGVPQIKLANNTADVNCILSTNSYIRRMKAAEEKKREAADE